MDRIEGEYAARGAVLMAVRVRYHVPMKVTPIRSEQSIDEETKRILQDRDAKFEDDRKTAVDARQAISDIRRRLEKLQPR
jgi:methylthioribose-1-phosphate isomerase